MPRFTLVKLIKLNKSIKELDSRLSKIESNGEASTLSDEQINDTPEVNE